MLKRLLDDDRIVGQYGSVTSLPGAADQQVHRDSPWLFGKPEIDTSVPSHAITAVIPLLYMSYQRHWFRDYDGYRVKPPIHVSAHELARIPEKHRHMFAWASADNTPETIALALKRAAKRALPSSLKAALRRLR